MLAAFSLYRLRFDRLVRLPDPLGRGRQRWLLQRFGQLLDLAVPQPRPVWTAVQDLDGLQLVLVRFDELAEARDERLGLLQRPGVEPARINSSWVTSSMTCSSDFLHVHDQVAQLGVVQRLQRLRHHPALHLLESAPRSVPGPPSSPKYLSPRCGPGRRRPGCSSSPAVRCCQVRAARLLGDLVPAGRSSSCRSSRASRAARVETTSGSQHRRRPGP